MTKVSQAQDFKAINQAQNGSLSENVMSARSSTRMIKISKLEAICLPCTSTVSDWSAWSLEEWSRGQRVQGHWCAPWGPETSSARCWSGSSRWANIRIGTRVRRPPGKPWCCPEDSGCRVRPLQVHETFENWSIHNQNFLYSSFWKKL